MFGADSVADGSLRGGPLGPGAASLGGTRCRNIGRLPFRRAPAGGHSSGRAPSTWERLTRSRSPIDRKPSPLRPSGFHRSSSYCHHDKHTRPLQPPSRAIFRADRVAPLPVEPCVAVRPEGRAGLRPDGGLSVDRSSAIHFRGRTIRSVSCYTFRRWCRLLWPHPDCLHRTTPFLVSHFRSLGTSSPPAVDPA